MKRPQLGRDVFARGNPESIELPTAATYSATLYDLISAYARQSQKRARTQVQMKPRQVWSLADAREALGRLIGRIDADWVRLDDWLIAFAVEPKLRRSARASSFSASLELVREGGIELKQEAAVRAAVPAQNRHRRERPEARPRRELSFINGCCHKTF